MTRKLEGKTVLRHRVPSLQPSARGRDRRILSVYDHEPICLDCKAAEEQRPDYESVSKEAIGQCLADTELAYGDPGGYCFHHFYPFTCRDPLTLASVLDRVAIRPRPARAARVEPIPAPAL